jgi:hypothetical protein
MSDVERERTHMRTELGCQLTSFCTVSFVLMRLECGSVHTKAASISLTLFSPRRRLMHTVRSSRDSHAHATQVRGGCKYRSHPLQHWTLCAFGIPLVMSTCDLMQLTHMPDGFACMLALQSAHSLQTARPPRPRVSVSTMEEARCTERFWVHAHAAGSEPLVLHWLSGALHLCGHWPSGTPCHSQTAEHKLSLCPSCLSYPGSHAEPKLLPAPSCSPPRAPRSLVRQISVRLTVDGRGAAGREGQP